MLISDHLSGKIINNHINLDDTMSFYPSYNRIKRELAVQWSLLGVFTLLYFLIGLIGFYLFSISAVSYAVACFYASKDTNFKQVIRVVPKAWKKLVITYLLYCFIQFVCLVVFVALIAICIAMGSMARQVVLGIVIGVIVLILFIVGLIYFNVIWSMASVVSVLEECYGLGSFKRSLDLMKGKKKLNIWVYMVFQVLFSVVQGGYWVLAGLFNSSLPVVVYVIIAIFFFLMFLGLVLLGFVVQTVLYLVCKCHHHEISGKSSLGDRLDGLLGGYGRMGKGKGVQLEQVGV
ncbi:hypothetical protein Scep_018956 [Stephania cephalantha]|uniref:Uncharacterized protein n=1 Tax=Stephania cephalantha TaxID=152367 RepID=A0AAP0IA35_9MAGN